MKLTFDLESPGQPHHSPDAPWLILDALRDAGMKATFFIQGRYAQSEPELVRRVAEDGHLIGMHSHFHAPWDTMNERGLTEDITTAAEVIERITGVDPRPYARAPFGALSGTAHLVLGREGLQHYGWTSDPGDWRSETTEEHIIQTALQGGTMLLHTWPATTARALPVLLDQVECERLDA